MMHVSMMIFGYASLLCGSLLFVGILVITFGKVIQILGKSNNLYFLNESFSFVEIQYMNKNERNNVFYQEQYGLMRHRDHIGIGIPKKLGPLLLGSYLLFIYIFEKI
ncbi:hypothetical protein Ahy_B03g067023 [Arachis hypogaea]|uniref:Cytochrome c assembly protein domain-containing protein n=1 Tax=Arachis hypogaea TaxID=3818 RepID=A0A445A5L5_ARAHY|nr:hypothetical protein Ahy_B03g067023 [Arachis hypogaea]